MPFSYTFIIVQVVYNRLVA